MKSITSNSFISKLLSWVIALSVFSYPITAVIILQLGLPGSITNLIIRALLSGLYVFLIFLAVLKGKKKWSFYLLPVIVFLVLYSFRLVTDISIRGIQIVDYTNFYVYSYYFGLILLPCFGIIMSRSFINYTHLTRLFFILLVLSNILLVFQMLTQGEDLSLAQILGTRAEVRVEGTSNRTFINPIVVGFFGINLSLFCISRLTVQKAKNIFELLMIISFICLGIINLFFGASRGPFFIFILLLLIIVVYYLFHERNKVRLFLRVSSIIIVFAIIINQYIVPFLATTDVLLFQRLIMFNENRTTNKKEIRDYNYESAWNDFLDSPVWGKQYVGTYDNFYPHNIPLEVLMSTGVIGFSVFLLTFVVIFISCKKVYFRRKNSNLFPIMIVGLISLLSSITSGSIFFTPNLWIFIILITLLLTNNENSYSH